MKHQIFLSLVVPAYKQEKVIYKNVKELYTALKDLNIPFELIVVADGDYENVVRILKKINYKEVFITGYEKNQGKGYAVRYGVEKAAGEIIGFIDAGMDIAPEGIAMLLNHMDWYKADVIVGSKLHPASHVKYPLTRKVLSWGYRTFTHLLFGFKIKDTQVGIKIFRRNVAHDVFPRLVVKQFAFDIEVLAVAYALGYTKIYEAPIRLEFNASSTITSGNFWKTILLMMIDTLAVYYRLKVTHYYDKMNR